MTHLTFKHTSNPMNIWSDVILKWSMTNLFCKCIHLYNRISAAIVPVWHTLRSRRDHPIVIVITGLIMKQFNRVCFSERNFEF